MRLLIISTAVGLFGLISCNSKETTHSINSFELSAITNDTINMVMDGKKQGLWLMPISKDTVVYKNDTAYSVIAPMTSGEMIRGLKKGFTGPFETYDSLVVKSN
jgi:hypothetical protein